MAIKNCIDSVNTGKEQLNKEKTDREDKYTELIALYKHSNKYKKGTKQPNKGQGHEVPVHFAMILLRY